VGRANVEGDTPRGGRRLEVGHELAAAVDLDGLDGDGHPRSQLVEEGGRGAGAGRDAGADADADAKHRVPADEVDGRERAPLDVGQGAQMQRVELDEVAGAGGCHWSARTRVAWGRIGLASGGNVHPATLSQVHDTS
jgi:hypothetical protein